MLAACSLWTPPSTIQRYIDANVSKVLAKDWGNRVFFFSDNSCKFERRRQQGDNIYVRSCRRRRWAEESWNQSLLCFFSVILVVHGKPSSTQHCFLKSEQNWAPFQWLMQLLKCPCSPAEMEMCKSRLSMWLLLKNVPYFRRNIGRSQHLQSLPFFGGERFLRLECIGCVESSKWQNYCHYCGYGNAPK